MTYRTDDYQAERARYDSMEYRRSGRADDGGLARTLASYLFYDRTLAYDSTFEQRMRALKPEDVRAALARVLDWKRVTSVKAGDFTGVGKKAPTAPAAPAP